MNLTDTLQQHLDLYDEIHRVLSEENRLLQTTRKPPGEAFLAWKRELLPRLDSTRHALVAARSAPARDEGTHKPAVERLQKKMLSLLLLDRENEKLLLKYSVPTDAFRVVAKTRPHLVTRAYSAASA